MPEGPPQRQGAGRLNEREDLLPILRVIGSNSIDLCRKIGPICLRSQKVLKEAHVILGILQFDCQ